jgi:hypothetical protein
MAQPATPYTRPSGVVDVPRKASCQCGTCAKCRSRLWARESRRRAKGTVTPAPIVHGTADPVSWNEDLTLLRRMLPVGAAIGISTSGVVIALIGERHRFASIDAAIDFATDPARAWPAEPTRGLEVSPRMSGTRR